MSFNQAKLWAAMQHPGSISADTVDRMKASAERYPYFQLLHTLIAKAEYDHQAPEAYALLGKAAVYAPDRRLLRQIFYDELSIAPSEDPAVVPHDEAAHGQEETAGPSEGETSAPEEAVLVEEETATKEEEPDDTTPDLSADAAPEDSNEKQQLQEELANTLRLLKENKERLPDSIPSTEDHTESPVETAKEEKPSPSLDESTENSEEFVPPRTGRSKQQDIIDRFMRANPSISRDLPYEQKSEADLSAGSTELHDDLVTENLAEIMLKQGKTDKAVDLYQKLTLKYPEKKAYFAQKIDQLKEN